MGACGLSDSVAGQIPTSAGSENGAELRYAFKIEGGNFAAAGGVSTRIKKMLQQIGVGADTIRRAAVATYEAEMNVVIHADSGEIILVANPAQIRITVQDQGPGIPDVNLAMQPGWSTASDAVREMGFGAGMGLPNIEKCTDAMEIRTEIGVGTTLEMVFNNG